MIETRPSCALAALLLTLVVGACGKKEDAQTARARAEASDVQRELERIIIDAQRIIDADVAALDDMHVHQLDESPGVLGQIRNRHLATHPQARPMIRLIIHRVIENAEAQIEASERLEHPDVRARAERTRRRARNLLDHLAREEAGAEVATIPIPLY